MKEDSGQFFCSNSRPVVETRRGVADENAVSRLIVDTREGNAEGFKKGFEK